jgi:hypothetical protein
MDKSDGVYMKKAMGIDAEGFTFDSGKAVQNIASIQILLHNITGLA